MRIDLDFELSDLQPLIERIVAEVIAQLRRDEATLGDRLTFTEPEAAALLSMNPWQLRDERYDKRINASVVRGGRIVYTKDDLIDYLHRRRWPVKSGVSTTTVLLQSKPRNNMIKST